MNERDKCAVVKRLLALVIPMVFLGFQHSCLGQNAASRSVAVIHYRTSDTGWYLGTGDGAPIITALVNGHPAKFLFDTGTTEILVTDEFIQHTRWLKAREAELLPGLARTPDPLEAQAMVVQVGPLTFTDGIRTVKNLNLSKLAQTHIDGILGESAIKNAAVLLSPTRDTLTFFLPGNVSQRERDAMGIKGAIAVPMKLTSDQLLSVAATLTRKTTVVSENLMIDTGAKNTVVSEDAFKALGGTVLSNETLETVWGNTDETTFTIDRTVLGGLTLNDPVLSYANSREFQVPAVLGRDILSKYRILIDPPAMMMYLLPTDGSFDTVTPPH